MRDCGALLPILLMRDFLDDSPMAERQAKRNNGKRAPAVAYASAWNRQIVDDDIALCILFCRSRTPIIYISEVFPEKAAPSRFQTPAAALARQKGRLPANRERRKSTFWIFTSIALGVFVLLHIQKAIRPI
jgi:hypothetical protein